MNKTPRDFFSLFCTKKFYLLFIFIYSFFLVYSLEAGNLDSLRMERANGQQMVVHQVGEKETLFSISRRYGTSIEAIIQQNEEVKEGLKIGQVIKVPYQTTESQVFVKEKPEGEKTRHIVKASETLFSISRRYEITIEDLKKWNNIQGNELSIGQELIVGKEKDAAEKGPPKEASRGVHQVRPSETLYSIARQYDLSTDQIMEWNNLESNSISIGQVLRISPPGSRNAEVNTSQEEDKRTKEKEGKGKDKKDAKANQETIKNPITEPREKMKSIEEAAESGFKKIVEDGIAEVIEDSGDTKKFLALHKTAPIGTIIQVKNVMNESSVFVRVVGKLPNTGDNEKILIKISKTAYDRLGALDPRFKVEVSYVP